MLISTQELSKIYGVHPNGVLHVGAHLAEEAKDYETVDWKPIIWIEANPVIASNFRDLGLGPRHHLIEAAIWNENNIEKELNISSNSQSSSFLDFGTHIQSYPDINYTHKLTLRTSRLDSIFSAEELPNFVNLDLQGVELQAIQGLGDLIRNVKWIYVEVNRQEVYKGCTLIKDLDQFLGARGFKRIATRWIVSAGWGDALYFNTLHGQSFNLTRKFLALGSFLRFYTPKVPSILRHLSKSFHIRGKIS